MTDDELRALVREAIARHLGGQPRESSTAGVPAPAPLWRAHPSFDRSGRPRASPVRPERSRAPRGSTHEGASPSNSAGLSRSGSMVWRSQWPAILFVGRLGGGMGVKRSRSRDAIGPLPSVPLSRFERVFIAVQAKPIRACDPFSRPPRPCEDCVRGISFFARRERCEERRTRTRQRSSVGPAGPKGRMRKVEPWEGAT